MPSKPNFDEKRHYRRIGYQTDAILSNSDRSWSTKVIDLSLKGCLLEMPGNCNFQNEDSFTIQIALSDSVEIMMQASLAHQTSNAAGFHCHHIDLDSISRLRRLVELNLGDSNLLQRDLEALAHSDV